MSGCDGFEFTDVNPIEDMTKRGLAHKCIEAFLMSGKAYAVRDYADRDECRRAYNAMHMASRRSGNDKVEVHMRSNRLVLINADVAREVESC